MPALQGGHLHVCDKTPWYRRAWFKTTDGSPSVAGIHRQRRRCIPALPSSRLPRAARSDQRTMCTRITTRYETSDLLAPGVAWQTQRTCTRGADGD